MACNITSLKGMNTECQKKGELSGGVFTDKRGPCSIMGVLIRGEVGQTGHGFFLCPFTIYAINPMALIPGLLRRNS
jgi:hypothetical protein